MGNAPMRSEDVTQDQIDAATEAFGTNMQTESPLELKARARELRLVIDLIKPEYHNIIAGKIVELEARSKRLLSERPPVFKPLKEVALEDD